MSGPAKICRPEASLRPATLFKKKKTPRNFVKFLRTLFYQEPSVAASLGRRTKQQEK